MYVHCTFTNKRMSKSYPCLVGCLPAILPGTAHPGPHVHEPAIPDESAWIIWTLPARTLPGLIIFAHNNYTVTVFLYIFANKYFQLLKGCWGKGLVKSFQGDACIFI